MFEDKQGIEAALGALAEHLEAAGIKHLEMVVCGGTALNVLGLVIRTTHDVDIVAFVDEEDHRKTLSKVTKMQSTLAQAAKRVQKDFNFKDNWLNTEAAKVLDFGFPGGLMERAEVREYGKNLTIHFISRYDQVHFKLYAALTSERRTVHLSDLFALNPANGEVLDAANWILTRDCAEIYKNALKNLLTQIGYKDVADKL